MMPLSHLSVVVLLSVALTAEACNVFSCPSSDCYWAGVGNIVCYDKENGGERCVGAAWLTNTGDIFDNWCWSNLCSRGTGVCCKLGSSAGCHDCSATDGTCQTCKAGYYHESNNCHVQKDDGESCSANNRCKTNNCKTRCCKSGVVSSCSRCSASGDCDQCSSSTDYPSGVSCLPKKANGDVCSSAVVCLSGICRGGRCCPSTVGARCTACSASQQCSACNSVAYYPDGTTCLLKLAVGGTCNKNVMCQSGKCRGGKCCVAGAQAECTSCGNAGQCIACTTGFYLESAQCEPLKPAGQPCSQSYQCDSTRCRSGHCCRPTSHGLCSKCEVGTGACIGCPPEYELRLGQCATPSQSLTTSVTATTSMTTSPSSSPTESQLHSITLSTLVTHSMSATSSSAPSLSNTIDLTATTSVKHTLSLTRSASASATQLLSLSATSSSSITVLQSTSASFSTTATQTVSIEPSLSLSVSASSSLSVSTSISATESMCNISGVLGGGSTPLIALPGRIQLLNDEIVSGRWVNLTVPVTDTLRAVVWSIADRPGHSIITTVALRLDNEQTDGEKTSPLGMHRFGPVSALCVLGTNAAMAHLSVSVRIPALDGFLVDEDEDFLIDVPIGNLFRCAGDAARSVSVKLIDATVRYRHDSLLTSSSAAQEVLTGLASAASLIVGAGGAVADQQTAVMIGMLSCSGPYERRLLGNYRLLAPTALSATFYGILAGNIVLVTLVLALFFVIVELATILKGVPRTQVAARLRFPSVPFRVVILTFQGSIFAAAQLATRSGDSATGITVGVLGLIAVLGLLPAMVAAAKHHLPYMYFIEYNYPESPYLKRHPGIPMFVWRTCFNYGRWLPSEERAMFGSFHCFQGRHERYWCTFVLWSPAMMGIASMLPPEVPCTIQFGSMAVLQAMMAALVASTNPYRNRAQNRLAAISFLCLSVILIGSAMAVSHPLLSRSIIVIAAQIQLGVSLMRFVVQVAGFILDRYYLRDTPRNFVFEWMPVPWSCSAEAADELDSNNQRKRSSTLKGDKMLRALDLPGPADFPSSLEAPLLFDTGLHRGDDVELQDRPDTKTTSRRFIVEGLDFEFLEAEACTRDVDVDDAAVEELSIGCPDDDDDIADEFDELDDLLYEEEEDEVVPPQAALLEEGDSFANPLDDDLARQFAAHKAHNGHLDDQHHHQSVNDSFSADANFGEDVLYDSSSGGGADIVSHRTQSSSDYADRRTDGQLSSTATNYLMDSLELAPADDVDIL